MMVVRLHPLPRFLVVTAYERVETSVKSQEKQCELALFGPGIEPASGLESRHRCLARPDHRGEVAVAQAQSRGGGENRFGENGIWIGATASGALGR